MTHRGRQSFLITVVAVMLVSTAARAEHRPAVFRGEATVNVVEVPVRVVDAATGEPVTGLTAGDFRILEDGVEMEISNFAEIHGDADQPAVSTEGAATNHRLEMVYLFDLYLMMGRDRDRAIDGLRALYGDGGPAAQLVTIVSFDGSLRTHVERSGDAAAVLTALDEVHGVAPRGFNQILSFTESRSDGVVSAEERVALSERKQRSREFLFELRRRSDAVGSAISAAMAHFAHGDGRHVMVVFTPGLPGTEWAPAYSPAEYGGKAAREPVSELWRSVALEASSLGVTCFAVDPSGVHSTGDFEAAVSSRALTDSARVRGGLIARGEENISRSRRRDSVAGGEPLAEWLERSRRQLLVSTAELTGGAAQFQGDIESALTAVQSTLGHYYSLAYSPDHRGDGRTYSIEVRVPGRSSRRLRHRTAYVDQPAATRQAQRLRSDMLFGVDANPLGIRVEIGDPQRRPRLGGKRARRVRVPVEVRIPFANIDMIDRGDIFWGKVLVTFFNRDDGAMQSKLSSHEQPIVVAADRYRDAVNSGFFSYKVTLETNADDQDLYIGVQDLVGGKTSLLPQQLEY